MPGTAFFRRGSRSLILRGPCFQRVIPAVEKGSIEAFARPVRGRFPDAYCASGEAFSDEDVKRRNPFVPRKDEKTAIRHKSEGRAIENG